jgi:hypothetical protein
MAVGTNCKLGIRLFRPKDGIKSTVCCGSLGVITASGFRFRETVEMVFNESKYSSSGVWGLSFYLARRSSKYSGLAPGRIWQSHLPRVSLTR